MPSAKGVKGRPASPKPYLLISQAAGRKVTLPGETIFSRCGGGNTLSASVSDTGIPPESATEATGETAGAKAYWRELFELLR